MSDLISRQAAIDAVEKESQVDGAYGYMDTKSIVDLLNDLPSAQPERKHGYWIESHEHVYMCNEVKEWTNWYCSECDAPNSWPTDYCPNCGARMEADDESN